MFTELDFVEPEAELDKAAIELYTKYEADILPRFPWVLVRVLPKEQVTVSGIYIADGKHDNKPMHEGIVLRTWAPFEKVTKTRVLDVDKVEQLKLFNRSCEYQLTKLVEYLRLEQETFVTMKSEYRPGEHVLYPHWSGMPLSGLGENRYRVVPEFPVNGVDAKGTILGRMDYQTLSKDEIIGDVMAKVFTEAYNIGVDEVANNGFFKTLGRLLTQELEEKFELVRKVKGSLTVSGA